MARGFAIDKTDSCEGQAYKQISELREIQTKTNKQKSDKFFSPEKNESSVSFTKPTNSSGDVAATDRHAPGFVSVIINATLPDNPTPAEAFFYFFYLSQCLSATDSPPEHNALSSINTMSFST